MNRLIPPLVVIAVAAVGWLGAVFVGRHDPISLSLPYDGRAGAIMNGTFRAERDGWYDVGLRLARPAADHSFPCVVSFGPPNDCTSRDAAVALQATISQSGRVLERGDYPSKSHLVRGEGNEAITLVIASAALKRGQTYAVAVSNARPVDIDDASPRITVAIQALDLKGEMILRSLIATAAAALGVAGAIWLAIALVLGRRRRPGLR